MSVSRKVGGAVERNRSSACCARRSPPRASRLPGDADVVVVARPDVRELAEREGLEGIRGALEELLDEGGRHPRERLARRIVVAPIRSTSG